MALLKSGAYVVIHHSYVVCNCIFFQTLFFPKCIDFSKKNHYATARHRAPEADFARGAARFSYDLKAVNEAAAGGGGGGEEVEGEGGGTAADRLFPAD